MAVDSSEVSATKIKCFSSSLDSFGIIINFKQTPLDQFDALIRRIVSAPNDYLNFDSVSDFYQAPWLNDLPKSAVWEVSGLDNGAEVFDVRLSCYERVVFIYIADEIVIQDGKK